MAKLAGDILTSDDFNEGPTLWTPVLAASTTSPTLGAGGSANGSWYRVGRLAVVNARFRFGSSGTSAGSGSYYVALPFPVDTAYLLGTGSTGVGDTVGSGVLRRNAVVSGSVGFSVHLRDDDEVWFLSPSSLISHTSPHAWSDNDSLTFQASFIVPE